MPELKKIASVIAALAISLLSAQTTVAEELPYESELSSCVNAIYQHINLEQVTRVRHIVSNSSRDIGGYELTIDTIVYRSGNEQRFESVCIARGDRAPSKLKIDGARV